MISQSSAWVVVPAYNEEKTIRGVVKESLRHVKNIVVVDDGSKDRTFQEAEKGGAKVLRHIVNMGKGAALKTGCDYALDNRAHVMIAIDADAQHKPGDIPKVLEALKGRDVVFTYRKLNRRMPPMMRIGNRTISAIVRILYHVNLRDTQCGFRAFTAGAYRKIRWAANDYSMESEMISNAGKRGLKYAEVPIETIYSDVYKGTTVLDGVKIVKDLLWWKLRG